MVERHFSEPARAPHIVLSACSQDDYALFTMSGVKLGSSREESVRSGAVSLLFLLSLKPEIYGRGSSAVRRR